MKGRFLLFSLLAVAGSFVEAHSSRADSLMLRLHDSACKEVFVCADRGDWRGAPENSLQAIENCIQMGADMVELSVRKTKDGHLIVMSDNTVDRTTTCSGAVNALTLSEIRNNVLRNGAGHATVHLVPTLEEALTLARDRILVVLSNGCDFFEDVYKVLARTAMIKQCIIKAEQPFDDAFNQMPVVFHRMTVMPVVKAVNENAPAMIEAYEDNCKPPVYEVIFDAENEKSLGLIESVRGKDAGICYNSKWPELCAEHDDDRAVEEGEIDQSWQWLLEHGAKVLNTDRPQRLLDYLKSINRHEDNNSASVSAGQRLEDKGISVRDFRLELASGMAFDYFVYSLSGTLVMSGHASEGVDISVLPAGVYIAVANDGTETVTLKFYR